MMAKNKAKVADLLDQAALAHAREKERMKTALQAIQAEADRRSLGFWRKRIAELARLGLQKIAG